MATITKQVYTPDKLKNKMGINSFTILGSNVLHYIIHIVHHFVTRKLNANGIFNSMSQSI